VQLGLQAPVAPRQSIAQRVGESRQVPDRPPVPRASTTQTAPARQVSEVSKPAAAPTRQKVALSRQVTLQSPLHV